MSTKKQNMGFGLIVLSFFFFFNFDFAIFDLLPDIFGYICIYFGLSRLADLNYHFEDARTKFKYGIYSGIAEILFMMFIFGIATPNERSIYILMSVFLFGVADVLIFLFAFKEFFEGFISLGTLCDGNSVFYRRKRERIVRIGKNKGTVKARESQKSCTEKVFSLTVVFIITRTLCTLLPELTSLIDNSEYRFVGLLRVFGVIISLIMGLIWIISVIRYIRRVKKDNVFVANIKEKYLNFLSTRPNLIIKRRLLLGMGVLAIGFILSFDFYADYFNLIPDFLSSVVIILGIMLLRRFSKKHLHATAAAVVYTAVSVLTWTSELGFFGEYYPQAALKNMEAYKMYMTMFGLNILDVAVFLWMTFACANMVTDIAMTHTAPENKTVLSEDDLFYSDLYKSRMIFVGLSAPCGLVNIYYIYFLTSYSNAWYVSMSNFFTIAADIVLCAYAYKFFADIKDEISSRYKNS